jgi:16S rRNA (uracil1498-N3)-methyltransferase
VSLPRFHVPEATPGARLALPEHVAHHARDVLRLRAGSPVRVFDGSGSEFEAVLEEVTRRGIIARLAGPVAPKAESALRLVLALPPLKGDRMEWAIEKATELGVTEIWPVVTARTDAAGRPALQGTRQERWEKVAGGAAEQCGRAVVPGIRPTTTFAMLMAEAFDGSRLLFSPLASDPIPQGTARPGAALCVVGPPGGWEPAEEQAAVEHGFTLVALGPRILRTETAAVTVVGVLQSLWGDMASTPR